MKQRKWLQRGVWLLVLAVLLYLALRNAPLALQRAPAAVRPLLEAFAALFQLGLNVFGLLFASK